MARATPLPCCSGSRAPPSLEAADQRDSAARVESRMFEQQQQLAAAAHDGTLDELRLAALTPRRNAEIPGLCRLPSSAVASPTVAPGRQPLLLLLPNSRDHLLAAFLLYESVTSEPTCGNSAAPPPSFGMT